MNLVEMTELADDCASAVYNICVHNPKFNVHNFPIGANGLSDLVFNTIIKEFKNG